MSPLTTERDLPAQHHAALLLDKAAFAEAGLPNDRLEARAVELAVDAAETADRW